VTSLLAPRIWLGCLVDHQAGVPAPQLSPQEWAWGESLAPLRRHTYWQSRIRLRRWLAGLFSCDPLAVPLVSPPGQPPRLEDGWGWLSLSHSGDGLLMACSAEPIGVDLELGARRLAADGLMRRFFPAAEVRQLEPLALEARRQAVLTSWVLKEAAIKWRRSSLAADLPHWCLDHRAGRLTHGELGLQPDWRCGTAGRWRWAVVGGGLATMQLDRDDLP
jgi:4'-phosphopantetheinyl transferase